MHTPATHPTMTVSRLRLDRIMLINELIPGIWLSTPPIRDSIDASVVRCWAKSSRVAYAWLRSQRGVHQIDPLERIVHHPVTGIYPAPIRQERIGLRCLRRPVFAGGQRVHYIYTHSISLRTDPSRLTRCTATLTLF